MKRRKQRREVIGVITKLQLLRTPKGHQDKIGGCGIHDCRPRRERTRGDAVRKVLRDWN
jgi:hypothetical protein